jgi:hypothetical protein
MEESGRSYDPESVREQVDELQRIFTPHFFEERKGFGDPSDLPVFVVGMPRSGTTLVHQIAASHPRVQGIGESRQMLDLAKDLRHGGAETEGFLSDSQLIHRAAAEHIQRLVTAHPGALRVIDKLPNNVYRLGLIAVLFPSARIVYCRRDARDTCLSCYFQLFHDLNSFSFDLAHCGYEFRFVERLMDHWRRVLPLKMLEVRYEELVADPEGQSRRLIDFLDLPWDLACLEFQRAPAAILTSSDWQVRQPIYHRSIGRWKHYQKHLGSLLAVLGR